MGGLFLGLIFGSVGVVYLYLGRRDHEPMYLIVGVLLIIYPYLFSNLLLIILIGAVLTAIPIARARGLF